MVTIETGVFVLSLGLAFGSMLFAMRTDMAMKPIIRVFSIIMFFVVGLYLVAGAEVSSVRTTTDGTTTWTETIVMVGAEADGMWLGYVLVGFAFTNFFFMYLDFFHKKEEEA